MPTSPIPDPLRPLRADRVRQIALFVMGVSVLVMPIYWQDYFWQAVVPLLLAIGLMVLCLVLSRQGRVEIASAILVMSVTAISAMLQWGDQGVRDASVLCFPAVLIMAGMLVNVRAFLTLLAVMIAYLTFMTFATDVFHWRVDHPKTGAFDHLRDVVLVLLGTGWAVWVTVKDLRRAMTQLREQMAKVQDSQQSLVHISRHDSLTGLPNRMYERQHLEQFIAYAGRRSLRVALLFIDLDNFKTINDSLGHAAGDEFLKEVARRLRASVREADVVSRHGGDEFVVGLADISGADDASRIATNILSSLTQAFSLNGTQFVTSGSVGVAMFPEDGLDYETLLQRADIAMYRAKESGRNAVRFFDASMNSHMEDTLLLVSGMRRALVAKQFALHYQPIVDLKSGRVVACEALLRWQHPDRGWMLPGDFIPAAEKSGLIVPMGEWVLHEACRQLVQWQSQGIAGLVMAVNLSTVQFRRGDIETVVASALQASGLRPECLELEITESILVHDGDQFIRALQTLKALGVKISIDDFGTGYSNLSYLQRFAVDKLKIDRSFVQKIAQDPQQRAIVKAVVQMAHSLQLETTAEGIEDTQTREILQTLGCGQGQGYLFAKPLAADAVLALLAQEAGADSVPA